MLSIPPKIHYCWFGKTPKPESTLAYMKTWQEFCPNCEIIEWNEDNFDIHCNCYVAEAYQAKKYAFVADYARLYALYEQGGLYLDTDMELTKPFHPFMQYSGFLGYEDENHIATAILATQPHATWVKEALEEYSGIHFLLEDGTYNLQTNVIRITRLLTLKYSVKLGNIRQTISGVGEIYPSDYFCPKNWYTGDIHITPNTHAIHQFSASWYTEEERQNAELRKKLIQEYGLERLQKLFGEK